jgi:hypothetical protein
MVFSFIYLFMYYFILPLNVTWIMGETTFNYYDEFDHNYFM